MTGTGVDQMLGILRWATVIFIIGLAMIVGYRMLTGSINMRGLLRSGPRGEFSPARVSVLTVTLFAAGTIIWDAFAGSGPGTSIEFSSELLIALGITNGVYLGNKYRSVRKTQRQLGEKGA